METKKSLCCGADMIIGGFHSTCLACMKNCFWQKNEDLTLAEVYAVKDDVISFKRGNDGAWGKFIASHLNSGWPNEAWLDLRYTITDRKSWHKHEKKEELSKEIKIGDTLTAEEAQKYIEAGGFVRPIDRNNIYRIVNGHLNYWDSENWEKSCNDYLYSFSDRNFTAVKNPEKPTESEVDVLKEEVEELKEKLILRNQEVSDYLEVNKLQVEKILKLEEQLKDNKDLRAIEQRYEKTIDDLTKQLEAERKKSEWLPYPENKPSGDRFVLLKDINGKLLIAFYYEEIDTFEYYHSRYKLDKSTIRFFKEV